MKDNLQVITSLMQMQERQVRDPEANASLAEARHRIISIASIHELLYRESTFSQVELAAYARGLVARLVEFHQAQGRIEVSVTGENIPVDVESAWGRSTGPAARGQPARGRWHGAAARRTRCQAAGGGK